MDNFDWFGSSSSPSSHTSNSPNASSSQPSTPQNLFPSFGGCYIPQMPQPIQQPYISPNLQQIYLNQQQYQQFLQWQQQQQPPPPPPSTTPTPTPTPTLTPTENRPQPISVKQPEGSKGKKVSKKNSWSKEDEILLATSWVDVSEDPTVGNSQKGDSFWYRVQAIFNKDTAGIQRTKDQLTGKWRDMKTKVSKFSEIYHCLNREHKSGVNDADLLTFALESYQANNLHPFPYIHVWDIVKDHPKWKHPDAVVPMHRSKKSRTSETSSEQNMSINLEDFDDVQDDSSPEPERPHGKPRKEKRSFCSSQKVGGSSSSSTAQEFNNKYFARMDHRTALKEDYMAKKNMYKDLEFLALDVSNLNETDRDIIEAKKEDIRKKYTM